MKKLIATALSLFLLCSLSFGQERLDVGDQIAQARANIGDLEQIVCTTVEGNPERAPDIVAAFVQAFPNLAEDIVFTAISCLTDVTPELLSEVVSQAILSAPGMAESIVFGARRATDESLHSIIDTAGQQALDQAIFDMSVGDGKPSSSPAASFDSSVLSPARTES